MATTLISGFPPLSPSQWLISYRILVLAFHPGTSGCSDALSSAYNGASLKPGSERLDALATQVGTHCLALTSCLLSYHLVPSYFSRVDLELGEPQSHVLGVELPVVQVGADSEVHQLAPTIVVRLVGRGDIGTDFGCRCCPCHLVPAVVVMPGAGGGRGKIPNWISMFFNYVLISLA